jgi:hypothetical protein
MKEVKHQVGDWMITVFRTDEGLQYRAPQARRSETTFEIDGDELHIWSRAFGDYVWISLPALKRLTEFHAAYMLDRKESK